MHDVIHQTLKKCRQGDREAFRLLYDTYKEKMYGVCCRYVDRDTAADLLQEGFMTVFSRLGEFRSEGSFEGWCRRIFVSTALDWLRKNRRERFTEELSAQTGVVVDSDNELIDRLAADEVLEAMRKLPEGYRTILNLYAVDGYSHAEIASMLGIGEGTSRSQYARAKTRLVALLTDPITSNNRQNTPSMRRENNDNKQNKYTR